MNKGAIIQRLLEEKNITAEEAIVLINPSPLPPIMYSPYVPPTDSDGFSPFGEKYKITMGGDE